MPQSSYPRGAGGTPRTARQIARAGTNYRARVSPGYSTRGSVAAANQLRIIGGQKIGMGGQILNPESGRFTPPPGGTPPSWAARRSANAGRVIPGGAGLDRGSYQWQAAAGSASYPSGKKSGFEFGTVRQPGKRGWQQGTHQLRNKDRAVTMQFSGGHELNALLDSVEFEHMNPRTIAAGFWEEQWHPIHNLPIAFIAAQNEYGGMTEEGNLIPERPFMRRAAGMLANGWGNSDAVFRAAAALRHGGAPIGPRDSAAVRARKMTNLQKRPFWSTKGLMIIGRWMEAAIRASIAMEWRKNAVWTLKKKKTRSTKPLIDYGILWSSVEYKSLDHHAGTRIGFSRKQAQRKRVSRLRHDAPRNHPRRKQVNYSARRGPTGSANVPTRGDRLVLRNQRDPAMPGSRQSSRGSGRIPTRDGRLFMGGFRSRRSVSSGHPRQVRPADQGQGRLGMVGPKVRGSARRFDAASARAANRNWRGRIMGFRDRLSHRQLAVPQSGQVQAGTIPSQRSSALKRSWGRMFASPFRKASGLPLARTARRNQIAASRRRSQDRTRMPESSRSREKSGLPLVRTAARKQKWDSSFGNER